MLPPHLIATPSGGDAIREAIHHRTVGQKEKLEVMAPNHSIPRGVGSANQRDPSGLGTGPLPPNRPQASYLVVEQGPGQPRRTGSGPKAGFLRRPGVRTGRDPTAPLFRGSMKRDPVLDADRALVSPAQP